MFDVNFTQKEKEFNDYMYGGAAPRDEYKLEFQILAAKYLRAFDDAYDMICRQSVTYNEYVVMPTTGTGYLLRGRVWSV